MKKIGRLILTTTTQMYGASFIEPCIGRYQTFDSKTNILVKKGMYKGFVIHLTPWRRNKYGEIKEGKALVIALTITN